jgi:hypothetical protein
MKKKLYLHLIIIAILGLIVLPESCTAKKYNRHKPVPCPCEKNK